MNPSTILQKLTTGNLIEFQSEVGAVLSERVENLLAEKRKTVVAEMFSKPLVESESLPRAPWTKSTIRKGLEEASLREMNSNK